MSHNGGWSDAIRLYVLVRMDCRVQVSSDGAERRPRTQPIDYKSIHWVVPAMVGMLISASMLLIFVGFLNYLVVFTWGGLSPTLLPLKMASPERRVRYAASAIAANTVMRSAFGAASPLFTRQMVSGPLTCEDWMAQVPRGGM